MTVRTVALLLLLLVVTPTFADRAALRSVLNRNRFDYGTSTGLARSKNRQRFDPEDPPVTCPPKIICDKELGTTCNSYFGCPKGGSECHLCTYDNYCAPNGICLRRSMLGGSCGEDEHCRAVFPDATNEFVLYQVACSPTELKCKLANETTSQVRMVNDECETGSQCVQGLTCGNGRTCQGYEVGHSCTFHEECANELYCSTESDTCVATKPLGASCAAASECAASGSMFGATCVFGKCVLPHSKKAGEPCLGDIECITTGLYCNTTCTPIPHTASSGGEIPCANDEDCASVGLQCMCNPEGRAVCSRPEFPTFVASERLQKAIHYARKCSEENGCRNGVSELIPSDCMARHCSLIHNCYLVMSLESHGFPASCFAPSEFISKCEDHLDSLQFFEGSSSDTQSDSQDQKSSSPTSGTNTLVATVNPTSNSAALWVILFVLLFA